MKLFYVLAVAILMSVFGIGCDGGGADPTGAGDTTPEAQVASVYAAVRSDVKVESGEQSVALETSKCIGLKADQMAGLKVSVRDNVLCGGEQGPACEAKHMQVTTPDSGNTFLLIDSVTSGCKKNLGDDEEKPAETETAGSADAGSADAGNADGGGAADAGNTDSGAADGGNAGGDSAE